MVAVLILVFAFRSSAALAYAYGMAVIGTITIITLLFFYLARSGGVPAVAGGDRRRRFAGRRPDVPRSEPDQAGPRGVAAAADRGRGVHGDDDVAAGTRIVTQAREKAEGPLGEFVDGLAIVSRR